MKIFIKQFPFYWKWPEFLRFLKCFKKYFELYGPPSNWWTHPRKLECFQLSINNCPFSQNPSSLDLTRNPLVKDVPNTSFTNALLTLPWFHKASVTGTVLPFFSGIYWYRKSYFIYLQSFHEQCSRICAVTSPRQNLLSRMLKNTTVCLKCVCIALFLHCIRSSHSIWSLSTLWIAQKEWRLVCTLSALDFIDHTEFWKFKPELQCLVVILQKTATVEQHPPMWYKVKKKKLRNGSNHS